KPANFAMIVQTGCADALLRKFQLCSTERDPECMDAVVPDRMDDQAAPTATDVEQPLPDFEAKFAADVIQFPRLGGIKILVGTLEMASGINHISIKPECVEVIGNVVVVSNGLSITYGSMLATTKVNAMMGRFCCLRRKRHHSPNQAEFVRNAPFFVD